MFETTDQLVSHRALMYDVPAMVPAPEASPEASSEASTGASMEASTGSHWLDVGDTCAQGRQATGLLNQVHAMRPSLASMSILDDLDVATLDEHERVLYLQAWEKQRGYVESHVQPALVAVAGPTPRGIDDPIAKAYGITDTDDVVREEVSAALGMSPMAAASRIDIARALESRLRLAARALFNGHIGFLHVRALVRETAALTDSQARTVDEWMASGEPSHSLSQWSRRVRRAVRRVAPTEFEVAAASASATRHVRWWPEADGMATVSAYLPAHDAQTVWMALDGLAHRDRDRAHRDRARPDPDGAGRTLDARRADALVDLALGALAEPDLPRRQGRPVELRVTVSLDQLLALREATQGVGDATEGPCLGPEDQGVRAQGGAHLDGYGPIPIAALRELIGDANWRRFVVDPVDGHLLDYGRTTYSPPRRLVDYIVARDQRCCFPGCPASAQRCDLDHVVAFNPDRDDGGGATSADNLAALCRRHHRLKTHGGWQFSTTVDGGHRWTSPSGMTYVLPAPEVLAD